MENLNYIIGTNFFINGKEYVIKSINTTATSSMGAINLEAEDGTRTVYYTNDLSDEVIKEYSRDEVTTNNNKTNIEEIFHCLIFN